jgi:predicted nucleotidyltransferase
MRISDIELQLIRDILHKADTQGRIYLFGSRVDDRRKGGDIDIFFEPAQTLGLKAQLALQCQLINACGMKVDLIVKNPGQNNTDIFDLARQGVLL